MTIHWVIVNYFNDFEVIRFINDQLLKNDFKNLRIYVVNNGTSSNEINKIKFDNVGIITQAKNIGYLASLNFIYESINSASDDVFILSNTDMRIPDSAFLEKLISEMKIAEADVLAPSVISEKFMDDQNPFYVNRILSGKIKFLICIYKSYLLYLIYQTLSDIKRKLFHRTEPQINKRRVYAIHGSFMAFNNKFMKILKSNREIIPFLFTEELFIAELARRNDLNVFHVPSIRIFHAEHSVTGKYKSRKNCKRLVDSLTNLYNKFYK